MRITAAQLSDLGACQDGILMFLEHFGGSSRDGAELSEVLQKLVEKCSALHGLMRVHCTYAAWLCFVTSPGKNDKHREYLARLVERSFEWRKGLDPRLVNVVLALRNNTVSQYISESAHTAYTETWKGAIGSVQGSRKAAAAFCAYRASLYLEDLHLGPTQPKDFGHIASCVTHHALDCAYLDGPNALLAEGRRIASDLQELFG